MYRQPSSPRRRQVHENALRVYLFIEAFERDNAYQPSMADLAKGCFLSRSTIMRYVDYLEAWGCVERDPGVARSIRIVGPLPAHLTAAKERPRKKDDGA